MKRGVGLADEDFAAFTDYAMPGQNGADLILKARIIQPGLPAVILTGFADVRTAVRIMEDGALTLLEKPYQPNELLTAVQRAVSVTQSRRMR